MSLHILPTKLSGTVIVPPSKSLLHRGLICSALSGGQCFVPKNPSDDIKATQRCLLGLAKGEPLLDCGESGTTLRLMVPLAAALGLPICFGGSGRLPTRPMSELAEAFKDNGVELVMPGAEGVYLPLLVKGKLKPGTYKIPGNVSSQYISGLLLALPLLSGPSDIVLTTPLESASYVELTLDVMRHFGVEVERTETGFHIAGSSRYTATAPFITEADCSQAAFWQLANYIGNEITISNLPRNTNQGDGVFAAILEQAYRGEGDRHIDARDIPDIVPALAAAAVFRNGDTYLENIGRLRLKESDRIESILAMLRAFSVEVDCTDDSIIVYGSGMNTTLTPCGKVDGAKDHRIVMTAAILATRAANEVVLTDEFAINKSYPNFFEDYVAFGGILQ